MHKFRTLGQPSSGRKLNTAGRAREREEEREKIILIVDITHFNRTKIGIHATQLVDWLVVLARK